MEGRNYIEDGVGYNALPMRALTEHLYDRAFWEALGKHRTGRIQVRGFSIGTVSSIILHSVRTFESFFSNL